MCLWFHLACGWWAASCRHSIVLPPSQGWAPALPALWGHSEAAVIRTDTWCGEKESISPRSRVGFGFWNVSDFREFHQVSKWKLQIHHLYSSLNTPSCQSHQWRISLYLIMTFKIFLFSHILWRQYLSMFNMWDINVCYLWKRSMCIRINPKSKISWKIRIYRLRIRLNSKSMGTLWNISLMDIYMKTFTFTCSLSSLLACRPMS